MTILEITLRYSMLLLIVFMLQKTVDDVESLMKRQEDFENTLQAQDDKVKALDELADKLIADNHPDKDQ